MMQTIVQVSLICLAAVMVAGCGEREPDWGQMTADDLNSREASNYYSIDSINECEPDSAAPLQQQRVRVRCRLQATMATDLSEIQAEYGGATESEIVSELVQKFGRFSAGEQETTAVTTTFVRDNGDWRVER